MVDMEKIKIDIKKADSLIKAKEDSKLLLRSKSNVVSIDIGKKVKDGKMYDEDVIKIYVLKKYDKDKLRKEDVIPSKITFNGKEFVTDVEEKTIPEPQVFPLRSRPVVGGSSIGPVINGFGGGGTLGVSVTLNDGNTYILSNNHVIAGTNQLAIGTNIVQPSTVDGGSATSDVVATLSNFIPLRFGTTTISLLGRTFEVKNSNRVDAALAQVTNAFSGANREIHWVGYPNYTRQTKWNFSKRVSLIGRRVAKMGRTTEYTTGIITSPFHDTFVGPYANGQDAWFEDQLLILGDDGRPFSNNGDSGSLVVDVETNEPLGLHFAGSGIFSISNPIDEVMNSLDIPQI